MGYKVITGATVEPLTLDEARTHLRIVPFGTPLSHPDDYYVSSLIIASRQFCENYTGRSFTEQTLELALDDFENDIILPVQGVASITSITYVDIDGLARTVPTSVYQLDDYSTPNKVVLKHGQSWAVTQGSKNNVKVRFVTTADSHEDVKNAIKLLIGSFYENRQEDQLSNVRLSLNSLPTGVYALLQHYRVNMGL